MWWEWRRRRKHGEGGRLSSAGAERGQSDVLSTVLMVGLVTITISVAGGAVIANYADQAGDRAPATDCHVEYDETLTIVHSGGNSIETSRLSVVFQNDSGTSQRPFVVDEGDGDGRFEVGESARLGQLETDTTVYLVTSNHVVCKKTIGVSGEDAPTTTPTSTTTTPTTTTTTTTSETDSGPTARLVNVTDESQCSSRTKSGKCKGKKGVVKFHIKWHATDDRGLRNVTLELRREKGDKAVDTATPSVNGTDVSGTVTLRTGSGYGREFTVVLTVTDSAGQTDTVRVSDTADGTDPA